ncbi:MAG: uncharacterized metal-binding protein YceD (DUF177 family) [Flavobacteriaceae bacterium]|jgi:uncharacterized metal-binding protein YceD (DUF177 family)|tara:strand:+ start:2822 stop:3343 length:522 start_codon:yes stop_codon:yes gene_type:complete
MEVLKEFTIPFVGLKDGKHDFSFAIDTTFFKHFEYIDFDQATLETTLVLDKKPTFLELIFNVKGIIILPCDVSTELFDFNVDAQYTLLVKFGAVSETISDEIIILSEGTYQINVAQYIYEMIILAVPQKRVHPGIEDGTLKSDIVDKLRELEPREENLNGEEDPRWNKLKDLL